MKKLFRKIKNYFKYRLWDRTLYSAYNFKGGKK